MLLEMFLFFLDFEPQRCYKEGCYSAKCVYDFDEDSRLIIIEERM